MEFPAQIKYIAISLLFILASINFTRTTLSIIKSSRRLDNLQTEVEELENKKISVEQELEYKKSDEYIEQVARNDLNLIKPGERVFVSPDVLSTVTEKTNQAASNIEQSNAKLWANLFF